LWKKILSWKAGVPFKDVHEGEADDDQITGKIREGQYCSASLPCGIAIPQHHTQAGPQEQYPEGMDLPRVQTTRSHIDCVIPQGPLYGNLTTRFP